MSNTLMSDALMTNRTDRTNRTSSFFLMRNVNHKICNTYYVLHILCNNIMYQSIVSSILIM